MSSGTVPQTSLLYFLEIPRMRKDNIVKKIPDPIIIKKSLKLGPENVQPGPLINDQLPTFLRAHQHWLLLPDDFLLEKQPSLTLFCYHHCTVLDHFRFKVLRKLESRESALIYTPLSNTFIVSPNFSDAFDLDRKPLGLNARMFLESEILKHF